MVKGNPSIASCVSILILGLLAAGCGGGAIGKPNTVPAWKVGFWEWAGAVPPESGVKEHPLDDLYLQVGRVDSYFKNSVSWKWPSDLPAAKEYWALWRYDPPAEPADSQIPIIARDFAALEAAARDSGRTIAGIQLDYDCPTSRLPDYALFLNKLSRQLPEGTRVSITALLDWFRPGTSVGRVFENISQFVPQFYDVAASKQGQQQGISEPLNPAKWAPVFNSFGIPYRLGISTFGRIGITKPEGRYLFRDLTPLDVLGQPGITPLASETTPAGDKRLEFRVERSQPVNFWQLEPGDKIELILPTQRAVVAAYDAAKRFGGFCSGIVFFRWPSGNESLILEPSQVLNWVSGAESPMPGASVAADEGNCVAVICWDIQLEAVSTLPDHPVSYQIRSSQPFEYFLPNPKMNRRIRYEGGGALRVELPAYFGVKSIYLGRAVTIKQAQFTVKEVK